ncbi:hypothetical protein B0T25DRAFT_352826 [Lasiosphaeria hispida]|uniref:Uncharacterized protein n=1 Tax=Lasiosphaeria hispida TaxID=260671 RepID=A0AAJ0H6Y3_9PEZI|nr:hypothetical protein B0T25DRAFT_352826 [Lasiosphaeria hispida]
MGPAPSQRRGSSLWVLSPYPSAPLGLAHLAIADKPPTSRLAPRFPGQTASPVGRMAAGGFSPSLRLEARSTNPPGSKRRDPPHHTGHTLTGTAGGSLQKLPLLQRTDTNVISRRVFDPFSISQPHLLSASAAAVQQSKQHHAPLRRCDTTPHQTACQLHHLTSVTCSHPSRNSQDTSLSPSGGASGANEATVSRVFLTFQSLFTMRVSVNRPTRVTTRTTEARL